MKNWKIVLLIPLYFIFTLLYSGVSLADSLDQHDEHHKALESSPDHEILEPKVPASNLAEVKVLKNTVAANAKTLSEAREIFAGKGTCHTCHGEKGKGDGEIADSMNPKPRDFTYKPWQKVRTDGEIFWAISNGTAGGESGMPPFGDILSDEERWSLVNYIRELGKKNSIASK